MTATLTLFTRCFLTCAFVLLSACTSKVNEGETTEDSAGGKAGCVGLGCAVCDLPWGGQLPSGQSVNTGFAKELVECSESCDSFKAVLTCKEGKLEGKLASGAVLTDLSKVAKSCFKKHCDCNHNGTLVEDGKERAFFRSASVSCPNTCTDSRVLVCVSGSMQDKLQPATKAHADNYKAANCNAIPCSNCNLPSGDAVAHGPTTNVTVYSTRNVSCTESCASKSNIIRCNNGVFSIADPNTFRFNSCAPPANCAPCALPCGKSILPGAQDYCFKAAKPTACGLTCLPERKLFKCNAASQATDEAGVAITSADRAAYTNFSCSEKAACTGCNVPGVGQVADGTRVPFYKTTAVECGKSCLTAANQVVLTCSNGEFTNKALYPDFRFGTCKTDCTGTSVGDRGEGRIVGEGGGAPNSVCGLPWKSGLVTHNTQIVAFSRSTVAVGDKCSNHKALITCNGYKGLWSGGGVYIYPTCIEPK